MHWLYPAVAVAIVFVIAWSWAVIRALREYNEAVNVGKTPPESTWSTRVGRWYVHSRPPQTATEARINVIINGCGIGVKVTCVAWVAVGLIWFIVVSFL
jgi:hypothetical protein